MGEPRVGGDSGSRCLRRETTVSPPDPRLAQLRRSLGSQVGGLLGREGAGPWGRSSVAVIFALGLCADKSIPAVVLLILMKHCH